MSQKKTTTADTDDLLRAAVERLLARADDTRALDAGMLLPRVRATLEKYLLRARPEATPREIIDFLDSLHADELILVVACERGDEAAWSDLMAQYQPAVTSAARSVSAGDAQAVELANSVWAELYGLRERQDGRPAGKLADYSGCGSLGGWLRAVVGQLNIDRHRKSSRLVQAEDAAGFDRLVSESALDADGAGAAGAMTTAPLDPERALAQSEAAHSIQNALARALGELSAEDRLLVKLYYLDELRLREAGAVLGVHEATASRRLSRLHAEIRRRVEVILRTENKWTREETARSLAEASSNLTTDLSRLLATDAAATTGAAAAWWPRKIRSGEGNLLPRTETSAEAVMIVVKTDSRSASQIARSAVTTRSLDSHAAEGGGCRGTS